jgi:hypothetical protein
MTRRRDGTLHDRALLLERLGKVELKCQAYPGGSGYHHAWLAIAC